MNASFNQVFAAAVQPEFFATGLDLEGLPLRPESETPCSAIVHELDVRVFELNDLAAVNTDQVVVGWAVDKIGIVGFLVISKINFMKQSGLNEERNGAIHGCTRGVSIRGSGLAKPFPEFIGGEMLIG